MTDDLNDENCLCTWRKFAIIDVRSYDFVGGNIPYCYHISFENVLAFKKLLPAMLAKFEHYPYLIFHCMYSQYRGPRAAYFYWSARRKWEMQNSCLFEQKIWILDGGFKQWISDYILDSSLVGNFDRLYWDEEFFPLTGREFFYNNDWKPSVNTGNGRRPNTNSSV